MNALDIEHAVPFGSREHLILALLVCFGRGMDLFSTWLATPTLQLEANPIARWLGWRKGWVVNLLASVLVSLIPLAAVSVTTTSLLVAARNAQSAWIVRSMGEFEYRMWIASRYRAAGRGSFLVCLVLNAGLFGLLGAGLMAFSQWQWVPFGVGLGLLVYAIAVGFYTGLAMRRAARSVGLQTRDAEEIREPVRWQLPKE